MQMKNKSNHVWLLWWLFSHINDPSHAFGSATLGASFAGLFGELRCVGVTLATTFDFYIMKALAH